MPEEQNELSDFSDIESEDLRNFNRGAVLANIHSKYVRGDSIPTSLIANWLEDLHAYLKRLPVKEIEGAKESMRLHLSKRDEIDG